MNEQFEKRKIISSFLLTVLIGHALKNMIDSVQGQILSDGLTVSNSFLAFSFFLVTIRFFIGNQLHLFKGSIESPGFLWLFDTIIIVIESIILILLSNVCLVEKNLGVYLGFKELLIILFAIDIFWVLTQNIMIWRGRKKEKTWKTISVPWGWAILNFTLCLLLLFGEFLLGDIYSVVGLYFLLVINLIAFVVDVILIDYYKAI